MKFRYTNRMSWSSWHQWSTEAGGLAALHWLSVQSVDWTESQSMAAYWFYCLYPFLREGTILLAVWVRRHLFIGSLGKEAPFYWLFQREGTIFLGTFERRLVEFIYLCSKSCWRLAGVSFYCACSTWGAGYVGQSISLVWPYYYILEISIVAHIIDIQKSKFANI